MPAAKAPPNSVHPQSLAEWRAWLAEHYTRAEGVWLITYKKATGRPRFDYAEGVEEALCFGWIDSRANTLDAERSMLWYAPRQPGTGWSRVNKERIERLIAAGRMAAPGLAKIKAAQADRSWHALDEVEALTIPPDLAAALAAHPPAAEHFAAFPRSAKRAILEWISSAKKPETRAKRVAETATEAAANRRANQWRQPSK